MQEPQQWQKLFKRLCGKSVRQPAVASGVSLAGTPERCGSNSEPWSTVLGAGKVEQVACTQKVQARLRWQDSVMAQCTDWLSPPGLEFQLRAKESFNLFLLLAHGCPT